MSKNSHKGNNGSESSPVNDTGMGIQDIVQMGEAASQLLNNPIYQMAHKLAVDQTVLEWSETAPKEKEKRDSLWHEVQAHGRTARIMAGFNERAQQVIQEQNAQRSNADYLDRQGFGLPEDMGGTETFQ